MSSSWKKVVLESFNTVKRSFKLWWDGMLVIGLSFSEKRRSVCTKVPGFKGCLELWISSETALRRRSRYALAPFALVSRSWVVPFSKFEVFDLFDEDSVR